MFSDNYQRLRLFDAEDVEVILDCAKEAILDDIRDLPLEHLTAEEIHSAITSQIRVHLEVSVEEIPKIPR